MRKPEKGISSPFQSGYSETKPRDSYTLQYVLYNEHTTILCFSFSRDGEKNK